MAYCSNLDEMDIEEAIRILDKNTTADAIADYRYYGGFNEDEGFAAVERACEIACEVMREMERINTLLNEVRS